MNEEEWLASRTSQTMLDFLRGRLTERKLRLIGCGCCRDRWEQLKLAECRAALEVAERIADGVATAEETAEGFRLADYARNVSTGTVAGIPRRYKTREARCTSWAVYELVVEIDRDVPNYLAYALQPCVEDALEYLIALPPHPVAHRLYQARVIRDVVGNPFRRVVIDPIDPAWRTSDVMLLANGIYAERAFDRMPILADALQDAGCTSDDILSHCRDTKLAHVRGCWVIDLVLGKQ
jgi:hypothetical protein